MKGWTTLCAGLALALALSACAGGEGGGAAGYDPGDTARALLDSGAFSEELESLDADLIVGLYGLEEAPAEAAVYTSTGATAEEIAVLRYGGEEGARAALDALETRVADQKEACRNYLPDELPKLEEAIIKQSGDTALLVVAADAQAAQNALDALNG